MNRESSMQMPESYDENIFFRSYSKNKKSRIRILIGFYKGYYGKLLLSSLFFIIKTSPVWVLPIVTSNIINSVTQPETGNIHKLITNIIVMLAFIFQNIPTNYLHIKYYYSSIRGVEAGLRSAIVRKLQQLSIIHYAQMQSGKLQSKIMRDVEMVEAFSGQLFTNLLYIILSILISLCVTLGKSRIVFVFFLLTIPIAVFIIVLFKDKIQTSNYEYRKEMEETSAKVMEMVELLPVTKAHGLQDYEILRMEKQLSLVAKKGYRLDIEQNLFSSISWVAFQVFQILCLGFTGYLAYRGKISTGEVVLYQSYFSSIVSQISSLIVLMPTFTKGMESVDSIGDILLDDDVEVDKNKLKLKEISGNFEFRNVHFRYPGSDKEVLQGLSLTVGAGETIAIVGESGAGKTTILNLIIGLIKPDSGHLLIDGKDMKDIDTKSYRSHLAVVPQNSILFSGTIKDNITYGMKSFTKQQLSEAVTAANLTQFLDSLPDGLDTVISEHGSNLSGGQKQRISIARALIRDPRIIILDEATSALDSLSEQKIQAALENLIKNRTTFIVAHRLSTIKKADKIIYISGGKCTETGTYSELMQREGEFYHLKKIQE